MRVDRFRPRLFPCLNADAETIMRREPTGWIRQGANQERVMHLQATRPTASSSCSASGLGTKSEGLRATHCPSDWGGGLALKAGE